MAAAATVMAAASMAMVAALMMGLQVAVRATVMWLLVSDLGVRGGQGD